LGDDGDPLGILILMDAATCTGCVVSARALGVIEAEQTQDGSTFRNDRIIAIAVAEHERASLRSLDEIAPACSMKSNIFLSPTIRCAGVSSSPFNAQGVISIETAGARHGALCKAASPAPALGHFGGSDSPICFSRMFHHGLVCPKDGIFARASLLDERLEFSSPKQAMPLLPIRHKLFRSLFNSGLSIASGSE
jgi:Inorganic pyrophosphatase